MGQAASPGGALPRRILLAHLPETDTRRLQVFVLVESDRLRQDWRIVTEGPADLYLYAADDPPTVPGWLERAPHQVRVVDGAGHAEAGDLSVLRRPLQYDDFVELLAAIEQLRPAPPAAVRMRAPAAASPRAARFRLRRWPGNGLLEAIPHGLRMASFITVRYLSADELASLSGVAPEGCRRFLDIMRDNDLLRAEPAATLPFTTRGPARPDRALLTSLRARLGIPTKGR